MNLRLELDWEEDEEDAQASRRRRAPPALPAGTAEQYMWFNTYVRPEGTLRSAADRAKTGAAAAH